MASTVAQDHIYCAAKHFGVFSITTKTRYGSVLQIRQSTKCGGRSITTSVPFDLIGSRANTWMQRTCTNGVGKHSRAFYGTSPPYHVGIVADIQPHCVRHEYNSNVSVLIRV
jgi:hypothetical protein